LIRGVGESPFTLELDPLPQDTVVKRDVFSFWCVLPESVFSDVASLLEGFSGIAVAGGVRVASLEERKAAYEIRLPASEIATRMKIAPERSPPTNESLLFLYKGSVSGGRTGSRISCISFQK